MIIGSQHPESSSSQAKQKDSIPLTATEKKTNKVQHRLALGKETHSNASLNIVSVNGDTVLRNKNVKPTSSSSSSTSFQIKKSSSSKKPEEVAYANLEDAYHKNQTSDLISALEELANLHLKKKEYLRASYMINGAIAAAERAEENQSVTDPLYKRLVEIEDLFTTQVLKVKSSKRGVDPRHYRQKLKKIRHLANTAVQKNQPALQIQKFLTKQFKLLLSELIKECMVRLYQPNFKGFSVIGLGSMARNEMSPYSDIEFAFLVKDPTSKNLNYLRALSQLLTLKVTNLGETEYKVIRSRRVDQVMQTEKSLTPAGFSIDIGGLSPLGQEKSHELIGSPNTLAKIQKECLFTQIIVGNAMTTVCHVMGDPYLSKKYEELISATLKERTQGGLMGLFSPRVGEERGRFLIKGHIAEFEPHPNQKNIKLGSFGVKQNLYRPIHSIVGGLSIYYNLKSKSTKERILELQSKKILTKKGGEILLKTLERISELRIKTQLFYKTEKETLSFPKKAKSSSDSSLFEISKQLQKSLIEIYRTLIPFHQSAIKFIAGSKSAFQKPTFYNSNIGIYADLERAEGHISPAFKNAQTAVALNPDHDQARYGLATAQSDMGKNQLAITNFSNLLEESKKGTVDKSYLFGLLYNISCALTEAGDFSQALKLCNQALLIDQQLFGSLPTVYKAMAMNQIGTLYLQKQQYSDAYRQFYHVVAMGNPSSWKSIQAADQLKGVQWKNAKENLIRRAKESIAASWHNLGSIYSARGAAPKAIEYYKESIKIKKSLYDSRSHASLARTLNELGSALLALRKNREAIEHYKNALKIAQDIFEKQDHPLTAGSLHNLGCAYREESKFKEAINAQKSALKMKSAIFNYEPHGDIVTTLCGLGLTYQKMKDYKRALEYQNRALKMQNKLKNQGNPIQEAEIHLAIGNIYSSQLISSSASPYYKKAYEISLKALGPNAELTRGALHNWRRHK